MGKVSFLQDAVHVYIVVMLDISLDSFCLMMYLRDTIEYDLASMQ